MSTYMIIDYDSLFDLSIPYDPRADDSTDLRKRILGRFPLATNLSRQLLELLLHNMAGYGDSPVMYTISRNEPQAQQTLGRPQNITESLQQLQALILRTIQVDEELSQTLQQDTGDDNSMRESSVPLSDLELPLEQWPPLSDVPQTPLVYTAQPQTPWWYFEYGDCGESLPLAVMTNTLRLTGRTAIRSISAFMAEFQAVESIPEEGPFKESIELKGPCLNCKSLMKKLPETISILGASGSSQNIYWEAMGDQRAYSPEVQPLDSSFRSSFQTLSGSSGFSLSAAYSATAEEIYAILTAYIFPSAGSSNLSADVRKNLVKLWYEFIIPYRDKSAIFRFDGHDNVQAITLTINGVVIPICSVFCAMGYILSTVLETDRVTVQQELSYLPLMAVLAKWCCTLCPWAHPNVVSVLYITSQEPGVETLFLLGTSKPSVQENDLPVPITKHARQMRSFRKDLLESRFGLLQYPCPEKIAAETRYLPT